jgi:acetyltransferase-like isoleucine patch superfamily enzyme
MDAAALHHARDVGAGVAPRPDLALRAAISRAPIRRRLGTWAASWGYGDVAGMWTVVGERLRGKYVGRRHMHESGRLLRLGRGFAIERYAEETRLSVGDRVSLHEQARIRLERRGAEVRIGDGSWIARRTEINAHQHVSIGQECAISWDVCIFDSDYHRTGGGTPAAPVRIGDHVWIGARATVLKGVTVGNGAIIAAGAVVHDDVPPRTLVAGVPARVVRTDVDWEP